MIPRREDFAVAQPVEHHALIEQADGNLDALPDLMRERDRDTSKARAPRQSDSAESTFAGQRGGRRRAARSSVEVAPLAVEKDAGRDDSVMICIASVKWIEFS